MGIGGTYEEQMDWLLGATYAEEAKYGESAGTKTVVYEFGKAGDERSKVGMDQKASVEGAIKNKKKIKDMQSATATTSKTNAAQVRNVLGGSAPQAQTPASILGGSNATKSLLGL